MLSTGCGPQPAESIDPLITDPAYESLEKHRAIGTTTRLKHSKGSSNDWFSIFPNARFAELFGEAFRVLRRNTHFARAEGVPRDPGRQVHHRQESLHRRLLRAGVGQPGLCGRVQVPGLAGHGRREDPLRARRSASAPDGRVHRAGKGFSEGVLHMLRAAPGAAYCLPADAQSESSAETRELDHLLAAHFGWWDVLIGSRKPVA